LILDDITRVLVRFMGCAVVVSASDLSFRALIGH
jgi:hypothetical protein